MPVPDVQTEDGLDAVSLEQHLRQKRMAKKVQARALFWMGWRISTISRYLDVPRQTIHNWRAEEKWDEAAPMQRIEGALEDRLVYLIYKDDKDGKDFKEIDLLFRQMGQTARIHRYNETGREQDVNPAIKRRNDQPKKPPERNEFSEEAIERMREAFDESLFDYQRVWWHNRDLRTRAILKSRQIGATWYFAREALMDALLTGKNKIFLSASKAQSHIFRGYMVAFANEVCGVKLQGDPIVLPNGATLYFLGTNAKTAQGYHGDFYFDEFFWVHGFNTLNKVASGMAMHKHWRKTYFSTPSSLQHEAYAFWSGERVNRKRRKEDRIELDLSHDRLAAGHIGEDKIWRQIVNIYDAERGGCTLFDIDELKFEYSDDEFDNLLMCGFIDDSFSVFPLSLMQACYVDAWDAWADFKPFATRPYGYRPVLVGYDPSKSGDGAGLVVLSAPQGPGDKFRVLFKQQFKGMDYEDQAREIQRITQQFNVIHIGIDSTGLGSAVFQLVRKFYPAAVEYHYDVAVKTNLVLKAYGVIKDRRLEFDAGDTDLARSFMAIKKVLTPSGRQATYTAGRTEETGHADLAWATMHAMAWEPIEGQNATNRGFVEIG